MKMKLYSLVLSCAFLMASSLHAQDEPVPYKRFGATLLAGFNASQIDGDGSAGFNKVGLNAGIQSDIFLGPKSELNIGIIFSQRGSRPDPRTEPQQDFKYGLSYAEIPVYYTFKDWYQEEGEFHRVRAFSGLSFGRLVGTDLEETPFNEREELLAKYSLVFHVGAGYNFNPNLRLVVEFMRDIIPVHQVRNNPNSILDEPLVNRTLGFRLEYSL